MENTSAQDLAPALTDEERLKNSRSLLLLCLSLLLILASVFLAFQKADPRGVYVFAYEISADGDRESGRNAELHLKSNGVATYVSQLNTEGGKIQANGSWKKDGNRITLIFQGEQTVFYRSGRKLIEKLENGGKIVYIKE